MGVTAIKRIVNNYSSGITVGVKDHENNSLPVIALGAGIADCDMWIPWCTSQADFDAGHYISITGGETNLYLWQEARADGDFVRFSTSGYTSCAPVLHYANVNGDRVLILDERGPALWLFGSSVEIPWFPSDLLNEHANWHMQHMVPFKTGEGVEFLRFHCQFVDKVHAWYDSQSFANQALVAPWSQLPSFFRQIASTPDSAAGSTYIQDEQNFLANPARWGHMDDDLGQYIGDGIHGWGHVVAAPKIFNDPFMSDFSVSPKSVYFYQWHGLINGWWRYWQHHMAPAGWTEIHCQPLPALAARFVSQSIPATLNPGQSFTATITMQNTGRRLGLRAVRTRSAWDLNRPRIRPRGALAAASCLRRQSSRVSRPRLPCTCKPPQERATTCASGAWSRNRSPGSAITVPRLPLRWALPRTRSVRRRIATKRP
ncbi:hypothetical protein KSC_072850 [Ktedonobacter sp. SOSP1-52]|nr:hypothetical protein KSC_072850 [Ktedonobacter sp. SOSP1-52]